MNWLRLRLVFSNGHVVAVIATFAAMVALPSVLQFDPSDGSASIALRGSQLHATLAEVVASQVFTVLLAAVVYLISSILTSFAIPISIASHGNVSDFVKHKYEAVSAAREAGEVANKLPSMSPGDHWRADLTSNPFLRWGITLALSVSLLAFALSFLCSFVLLQAALQL